MSLRTLDHPIIKHKLTILRDKETPYEKFRSTIHELVKFMIPYTLEHIPTRLVPIETPLEKMDSDALSHQLIVIPILRAGLGMSDPFVDLVPETKIGHIGIQRNPDTFEPEPYYFKMPPYKKGDHIILVDPMLATGGSIIHSLSLLKEKGYENIVVMTIISSPEGIENIQKKFPNIDIITASVDRELDENAYILPGLGDAGDRIFGTEH